MNLKDIETFDLEAFKYNFVNVTAFRMVDSEYFRVTQILKEMERVQMPGYNHSVINRSRILEVKLKLHCQLINLLEMAIIFYGKVEPALFYESVHVFAHGLQALDRSSSLRLANLSCEAEVPWNDGSSLFNYINAVSHEYQTFFTSTSVRPVR